jgi:hypothetical protein
MVLFNGGPKRFDPTCVGQASLPHYLVSSDPSKSERLMASGNERGFIKFNSPLAPKEKLGYFLNTADAFSLIVDFMNEKPEDKVVYMTITYDYVDGRPPGFSNYRTIWLDVAQCGTSEVRAPKESGQFMVQQTWKANLNGDIIGAGGHLHDGGVRVALEVDGKEVCDSRSSYAVGGPGGMAAGGMGGGGMSMGGKRAVENLILKRSPQDHHGGVSGGAHISGMTSCGGSTMGVKRIVKGQKWVIKGYYDYDKHAGMKEKGKQSNVMAIAIIMYVCRSHRHDMLTEAGSRTGTRRESQRRIVWVTDSDSSQRNTMTSLRFESLGNASTVRIEPIPASVTEILKTPLLH